MKGGEAAPKTQIATKKKLPIWANILIGMNCRIHFTCNNYCLYINFLSEKTSKQHLNLIKDGELEKAYKFISKEFQDATSMKQFEQFVENYSILSENESYSFNERSVEDESGTVKGTLTAENDSEVAIEYISW